MRFYRYLAVLLLLPFSQMAKADLCADPVTHAWITCSTPAPTPTQNIYPAKSYGACTWDSTHDVGACVNTAISAAMTDGGGTVVLPCGTFGLTNQVLVQTSGVHLQGCGVGIRGNGNVSLTRLVWVGAATATPAMLIQTAAGGGALTISADVTGIAVDCAYLCNYAIKINGVSYSVLKILGAGARVTNVWFTTPTDLIGLGNQHLSGEIYSYDASDSYSPTGILLDAGCTFALGCFNTSLNNFDVLSAWYHNGDGIVFADSDNNRIAMLRTVRQGTTQGGAGVVCANSAYVPPSGEAVIDRCEATHILHDDSRSVHVAGYQTGATFTATGGNGGTAALNPLTISTSATSAVQTSTLTFTDTTGAAVGETVSCGGPVNGVFNGTPISAVTSTTLSIAPAELVTDMGSSKSCTLTYGIQNSAVTGSYSLRATSSTLYTLTAPAGGHTQSGISVASGLLTFTDMIIPWTGTPSTNDTWTIVVPIPPDRFMVEDIDRGNHVAIPTYEAGTSGSWRRNDRAYPTGVSQSCVIGTVGGLALVPGVASGDGSCAVGGDSGSATGLDAIALGGSNVSASGSYGVAVGGINSTASGYASLATGSGSIASGLYSISGGAGATDRGRQNLTCYGGTRFAAIGDNQTCYGTLHGTGANGSAIRLTASATAASSLNCINIPNNAAYAVVIDIVAFDQTTVTKFASWNNLTALLTRGANAAATAIALASATPSVTYSGGTLSGNAMSITADTTNGCINISWTPPTSNTDTWDVVAWVRTTEVQ